MIAAGLMTMDIYISFFFKQFKPTIALILLYSEVIHHRMDRDSEHEFSGIVSKSH